MPNEIELPDELVAEVEAALPCEADLGNARCDELYDPSTLTKPSAGSHGPWCPAHYRPAVLAILRRVVGEKEHYHAHYEAALANWNEMIRQRDEAQQRIAALEGQVAELQRREKDGFCSHLEVLCGNCTQEKGFAIWHRPPTCEEAK